MHEDEGDYLWGNDEDLHFSPVNGTQKISTRVFRFFFEANVFRKF